MTASEFDHFLEAQAHAYVNVMRELSKGEKKTHWMWFIFPQLQGLGHSSAAQRFGIESLKQAKRYLDHEVLGSRLRHCTQLVLDIEKRSLWDIFGSPDDLKFRSSITLFHLANPDETVFALALAKYCSGLKDERTVELLG